MINFKKSITVLYIVGISVVTSAQPFFGNNQSPRFGLLDRSNGLNSLSISSIQQDKYGFLWFGSQGGLSRYDGKNIVSYAHDPFDANTLGNDLVQSLYYDEQENLLWIGTYGGLSCLDIDSGNFSHIAKKDGDILSLSHNIVASIAKGRKGDLWIGTLDGLNRISSKDSTITHIETKNSTIRSILLDSNEKLWIGTYDGFQYWDESTESMKTPNVTLPSKFVMSIIEAEPGHLIIGMWGGSIVEYWPDTNKLVEHTLPDDRIYTLLKSSDGTIWAGSWGGGLWANPVNGDPVWFENSENSELENSVIYSLYEDKGGLVWVGTNGGGVHYLSPRRSNFREISNDAQNKESISKGKISVIHKDNENTYLSIVSAGLNIINNSTGEITKYISDPENKEGTLSDDVINHIFEDSKGNFWIANNSGLDRFNKKSGIFENWSKQIHKDKPLSHHIIYYIIEDKNEFLWIATFGAGIDRYNPKTNELVNYDYDKNSTESISDSIVHRILEMSDGTIWFGTNNGLNRYNPETETFTRYIHDKDDLASISGNNIHALVEDSSGRLWIGTYGAGLNCYNKESDNFVHYTTKEGLSSNNILSIIIGNDKKIWFSTRGGINILTPETGDIRVMNENDGLFGVFFNYGHYKDDDAVYFGGSHGVTKINTYREFTNLHKPDIHITNLSVMGNSYDKNNLILDGKEYSLDYSDNYFSFNFIALDYELPINNKYAYMLEGFDSDWIYSDKRSYASYTNLSPGKYIFRVKGSNNDLLWNNEGAFVSITIKAPWYLKWWAYLLYLLIFFIIIFSFWKIRTAQLLSKKNNELKYTNSLLEEANKQLEVLSIHDGLTKLYNRRYFNNILDIEIKQAIREKEHLTLLMIDIDHFKEFNDNYGHLVGDEALLFVSRIFQNEITRKTDYVARFGGEEFTIILDNTDLEGAKIVAENLQNSIRISSFIANNKELQLSVSIGIYSSIPTKESSKKLYIECADIALYNAKKNGRNRTEIFKG